MSMLSEASKAYAADKSREHYDELLIALMLCVTRDDEVLVPGQIVYNEKREMDVQLGMVSASDGKWYYLVCSCPEELRKIAGAQQVSMKLADLLRRVKAEEQMGGIIIDPMNGANCFVSEEDACVLLDNLANTASAD